MKVKRTIIGALVLLLMFIIWTIIVCTANVKAIGPYESEVGLATINESIHNYIGVNMTLYSITDILSIIPIGLAISFAITGLVQLIRRRSLIKIDRDILCLGVHYVAVMLFFILFEIFPVNYRPVLIEGTLEASYPSSTTLLVISVMLTANTVFRKRIKSKRLMSVISIGVYSFTVFMVIGRIISGVHWFSDIIGGILLSTSLLLLFSGISE